MPEENSIRPPAPAKPTTVSAPTSTAKSLTPLNIASEHPVDPAKLTPEEQMALFEKDLKENDWGHQPC